MNPRRASKAIHIGKVTVGGGAPIVVQSMTKTDTRDIMSTIVQIRELADCGCELVRVAVPDAEAAQAISEIKKALRSCSQGLLLTKMLIPACLPEYVVSGLLCAALQTQLKPLCPEAFQFQPHLL